MQETQASHTDFGSPIFIIVILVLLEELIFVVTKMVGCYTLTDQHNG